MLCNRQQTSPLWDSIDIWTARKKGYRQQPSPLLYSIDISPARNSRLTQREMNYYIARQLVIDLYAQHHRFAVCCPLGLIYRAFFLAYS